MGKTFTRSCNKYTEAVKKKEKLADKLKQQLKRYDFYFTRYMNYKKAAEVCDTQLREKMKEKKEILIAIKKLPFEEVKFIIDALDIIVKAKNILKNSYVFNIKN